MKEKFLMKNFFGKQLSLHFPKNSMPENGVKIWVTIVKLWKQEHCFGDIVKNFNIFQYSDFDPTEENVKYPTLKAVLKYKNHPYILAIRTKCNRNGVFSFKEAIFKQIETEMSLSCNLMREANIWITSYRPIIFRGNSSGSSFLSTRYQFASSGISIFWFWKIPSGLLRFLINKTKTLRNHQTFHDLRLEKNLKRCVCIKRCGVAAKIEVQEGCENMGKSSFAFKKSAIKRS